MSKIKIIITGTDPDSAKGGIGVVLPGYFTALNLAGYNYECISTYNPTSLKSKWLPWLKAFPKLINTIRKLKKENNTVIIYSHVGDGVSFLREACILWLAKLAGAKTLLQIHSPKVDKYLEHSLKYFFLKLSLTPADKICVLTNWWKNRLLGAGIKKNIYVIPNPLPDNLLKIASCPRKLNSTKDHKTITILSMARLVPGKGVDIMIRSIKHLPNNVNLTVAGDGDQRKNLEALARDLGVADRIHFAGWVSGSEKTKLLEHADIFCLPSTYDAFPMSMVEAMAYGIPVVAVRWGGIPDMMADEYSGFLAEQPQAVEISAAIKKLLDTNMRLTMGAQAKKWVVKISHPEHVAKELRNVIEELSICQ